MQEFTNEAIKNILPFWQNLIDIEQGGFYGRADFTGLPDKKADKGCILNSRILWTFSSAFRRFGDESYKKYADHAFDFLCKAFCDKENGGLHWLVDYTGKPVDSVKGIYNIAFAIYGLAEYYRATKNKTALNLAMSFFDILEKHALDPTAGGYIETKTYNWQHTTYSLLCDGKAIDCKKSMNTNLHVLEAYTTLLLATGDTRVRKALDSLTRLTMDKIINKNWQFDLYFDMDWNALNQDISYGHDIEGSWLLYDAALVLKDEDLIAHTKTTAINIAMVVYENGRDTTNGGLFTERDSNGRLSHKKDWWSQAEAIVGFYNAYQITGDEKFKTAAEEIWDFTKKYFIDKTNGEWHNEIFLDNTINTKMPKAGFWKCPYHNARMCFEMLDRLSKL